MLNFITTVVFWAALIVMGLVLIPLVVIYVFVGLMVFMVLGIALCLYWIWVECIHMGKTLYLKLRRWYGTPRRSRT